MADPLTSRETQKNELRRIFRTYLQGRRALTAILPLFYRRDFRKKNGIQLRSKRN